MDRRMSSDILIAFEDDRLINETPQPGRFVMIEEGPDNGRFYSLVMYLATPPETNPTFVRIARELGTRGFQHLMSTQTAAISYDLPKLNLKKQYLDQKELIAIVDVLAENIIGLDPYHTLIDILAALRRLGLSHEEDTMFTTALNTVFPE